MRLKSYLIRLIGLLVVFSYLALPSPVQAGCGTTNAYLECPGGSCSCPSGYSGSCVCQPGDDKGIPCTADQSGCTAPTATPYPCIKNGGYCSPEPCGDDSCGSGSCGGWYCCKACPTSTPAPTSTPLPTATPPPCSCSNPIYSGTLACCTRAGGGYDCDYTNPPNNAKIYDYCYRICSNFYYGYIASCALTPTPGAVFCDSQSSDCHLVNSPFIECGYSAPGCNNPGYGRVAAIYCATVPGGTQDNHCGDVCIYDVSCLGPTATSAPAGPTNTPAPTATPTNTPTPTATPTPTPGPWVKLKNSSFYSSHSLTSLIPLSPVAYDSDDDATVNFIIGEGGLVAVPYINLTGINPSAKPSANNWSASYSPTFRFQPPVSFLAYVKSRKEYKTITSLDEIDADGIYFYDGDLTFDSVPSQFNSYNVVLISSGTVTINTDLNKTADPNLKSIAILAPTINFAPTVTQADGIFIASTVDTGANANQGLKIVGNLIAQTSLINQRQWSDPNKPVLFIVFDSKKYLDLLPYLSTANYEWKQTQ